MNWFLNVIFNDVSVILVYGTTHICTGALKKLDLRSDSHAIDISCPSKYRLGTTLLIRPNCRDVLWYGVGVCLSVCLSVYLSVRLSTKLVDTIQTEPFQLGPSNLIHILLMTRGRTLLIFKVMGQRSRSQATHSC